MILHPFSIFKPFSDRFTIALFTKDDDIRSDADAARHVGATMAAGLQQVHGNVTVEVDQSVARTIQADGMITKTAGLALCIRSADCQTFVLYDPVHHVAGVLHAGWKGLIAGAIPRFLEHLQSSFDVDITKCLVGAGPSLCIACADFTDPITELPTMDPSFINGRTVDLRGFADGEFLRLGIGADHLERSPDCTRCQPKTYWTYRGGHREEVKKGRTNMLVCSLR